MRRKLSYDDCNVVMFKATHPPIIHHHINLFIKNFLI